MINVGPYSIPITIAVLAATALPWLVTLLLAAALPANRTAYGVRRIDAFVIVFSVAFGIAWFSVMILPDDVGTRPPNPHTTRVASCLSVKPGLPENRVRELLGAPDEIRETEDVRGPGADVWLYRRSRCAIHTLNGTVVSIE